MSKRLLLALFAFSAVIVGCGSSSSETEWASEFRTTMAEEWTDMPADEQSQLCTAIKSLSDEEIKQEVADEFVDDIELDALFLLSGETPTAEHYELATNIAIEELRSVCSE